MAWPTPGRSAGRRWKRTVSDPIVSGSVVVVLGHVEGDVEEARPLGDRRGQGRQPIAAAGREVDGQRRLGG